MSGKAPMANETHALNMNNQSHELTFNELDGVSGGADIRLRKFWIIPARSSVDGNGTVDALTDGVLIVR